MAEFRTTCPHCNGTIEVEPDWVGMEVDCPQCDKNFVIRAPAENGTAVTQPPDPEPQPEPDAPAAKKFSIRSLGGVGAEEKADDEEEEGAARKPEKPKPLELEDLRLRGAKTDEESIRWLVMNATAKKKGVFGKGEMVPGGPYTHEELVAMVLDGSLEQYHMIRPEDSEPDAWRDAGELGGLFTDENVRARSARKARQGGGRKSKGDRGVLVGVILMGLGAVATGGVIAFGYRQFAYYPPIISVIGLLIMVKTLVCGRRK